MAWLASFAVISTSLPSSPCTFLEGNWTSTLKKGAKPHDTVHIEFFQNPGQLNFTLRATPWGGSVSHGYVAKDGSTVSLLMIGGKMQTASLRTSTFGPSPAPCSTFIDFGWCKYPYCPNPQPDFPPFPEPDPPNPDCSANGDGCPPPSWDPNYNLTQSTVIQPSSDSYFMPKHPWELALEWEESQRKVMYDESKADYFLQYTDGRGNKNGTIYNEGIEFGDQYFWDYTNEEAAEYFVKSIVGTLNNPWAGMLFTYFIFIHFDAVLSFYRNNLGRTVDGSFSDDVIGVPQEHEHIIERINMTAKQLKELQFATAKTHQKLVNSLIKAKKYNWQAFGGGDGTGPGLPRDSKSCIEFMTNRCDPSFQERAISQGHEPKYSNQSIASFLITRPPIAFLGFGWESDDRMWDDQFYLQVGEPQGLCKIESPGVFSRQYTNGKATLDCNTFEANLPFPSLK
eukprot:UC4_evm3s135